MTPTDRYNAIVQSPESTSIRLPRPANGERASDTPTSPAKRASTPSVADTTMVPPTSRAANIATT